MMKRLYLIACDFCNNMVKKNIAAFASSTAFFLFVSLIPMLLVACTILPFTPVTESFLMEVVDNLAPASITPFFISMISDVYDKSAGVLSIATVATIWAAGKGMLALMRGLNEINDVPENRNYFVLRAVACFYTIIMIIVLLLTLVIGVFGNVLVGIAAKRLGGMDLLLDPLAVIQYPVSFLVLTLGLSVIYAYVPGRKMGYKMQLPGAIFAALVWMAFTYAFSIYVDKFNGFSTYGSLATIVIVMLWLYACMYIILIGAYINRYFKPAYQFLAGKRKSRS